MESSDYSKYLGDKCDAEEIVRLHNIIFVQGHLERLEELLIVLLPLANIIYYKYIKQYDDFERVKEDLISESMLNIYKDMKYRWDKYIRLENPFSYFGAVLKNNMLNLVHYYNNYYLESELDPDIIKPCNDVVESDYDILEIQMLKEKLFSNICATAERVLSCRPMHTKLLLNIFKFMYVEKDENELESLKTRVRVLGITNTLFNFYIEHVRYVYKLAFNYHYSLLKEKNKMINRISDTINRFEDVTYKMLAVTYYDSLIPEIYAELGPDVAKNFIKIFSGRTVQVPLYREFCDNMLGGIVLSLAGGDKTNLYRIAEEYKVPYKTLARIYDKASKYDIGGTK